MCILCHQTDNLIGESFCEPGDECLVAEGENPSVEPTVGNLEAWLEYQSTQIGTPVWWKELEAVPDITN